MLDVSGITITCSFDQDSVEDQDTMMNDLLDLPHAKTVDCGGHWAYIEFMYSDMSELLRYGTSNRERAYEIIEGYKE